MIKYGHDVILVGPSADDIKLAELMGLKHVEDGDVYYKSFGQMTPTLFTCPPTFSKGSVWISPLVEWAKERGIRLKKMHKAEELVKELIAALENKK